MNIETSDPAERAIVRHVNDIMFHQQFPIPRGIWRDESGTWWTAPLWWMAEQGIRPKRRWS